MRIGGSTPWSAARRLATINLIVLIVVLIADMILAPGSGGGIISHWWMAATLAAFSVVYFLIVVIGVIFLTSEAFRPNPRRLALDTAVSILFSVLAFMHVYRFGGISLGEDCVQPDLMRDYLYFSTVTFSTLGYGDFRPCDSARLIAAFHAIFGNLHLGLIVGSAFFFAQERATRSEDNPGDQRNIADDEDC